MFDMTTAKGKIIAAAMKLAAEHRWQDVTLRMIAGEAGVSMSEIKREVSSKAHIFGLFTSAVDKEVLAKVAAVDPDQSVRDNLFETIMNRFDIMQPYKQGIRSILAATPPDPRLVQRLFSSQAWMLEAAGISSYGPVGNIKTAGLASLYMQVVQVWLEDDDPDMARTMAALDRRLRRGERSMQALDDGVRALGRMASILECRPRTCSKKAKAHEPSPSADQDDTDKMEKVGF
ncbi:MAG: helix-turn-helix domain-containing protein [Pseudomonadota bacterium]